MRRATGAVAWGLMVVLGITACQGESGPSRGVGGSPHLSVSANPQPKVTFSPAEGSSGVRPDQTVVVSAHQGTLSSVVVRSGDGKQVAGALDSAHMSWRSSSTLATGATYTVTAVAASPDGHRATDTATFSTLKPSSTMSAVLLPGDDWTVGVGMPIVVQFSRSVKNRDAAVKALKVTTTPTAEGAWHWMTSDSVWWRPKEYWRSGTKVLVTAALDSAELAPGVWGRRTYTSSFSIGSQVISTVDVQDHTMTVRKDGEVVRVLPVTTGKAGYLTRNGVKVIMDKKRVERMDAASTGTDPKDSEYYNVEVQWAMRLTWSGEYIHAAPWSVASQGRANVSHGCTGLSTENAKWMYDFSKIGDVVVYKGSPRALEPGNGYTAWNVSFQDWADATGT